MVFQNGLEQSENILPIYIHTRYKQHNFENDQFVIIKFPKQ